MLRVAAVTAAALLAFLVSCFSKPGAPHVTGDDDDIDSGMGTDSGSGSGSGGNPCAHQPFDTFDPPATPICGAWGGTGSGAVSRANGRLSAIPGMTFPAGCETSLAYDFANGASIEIPQIAQSGTFNTTYFRALSGSNNGDGMEVRLTWMQPSGGMTQVQCLGSGATPPLMSQYNSLTDRWWKFEPTAGNAVKAFKSADGQSWNALLFSCSWGAVTTAVVKMGVEPSTAASGTEAQFDNFNVKTCPP